MNFRTRGGWEEASERRTEWFATTTCAELSALIPYMLFSQLAHLSESIQVKTTASDPWRSFHACATFLTRSAAPLSFACGAAVMTTNGL